MESLNEHWLIIRLCNLKNLQYVNMIAHKKISKKKQKKHNFSKDIIKFSVDQPFKVRWAPTIRI